LRTPVQTAKTSTVSRQHTDTVSLQQSRVARAAGEKRRVASAAGGATAEHLVQTPCRGGSEEAARGMRHDAPAHNLQRDMGGVLG